MRGHQEALVDFVFPHHREQGFQRAAHRHGDDVEGQEDSESLEDGRNPIHLGGAGNGRVEGLHFLETRVEPGEQGAGNQGDDHGDHGSLHVVSVPDMGP